MTIQWSKSEGIFIFIFIFKKI